MNRVYTGNPQMDAEVHQQRLQEARNSRDFIECDICHGEIFREDDEYEGDVYYELDGLNICEECLDRYLKDNKHVFK